MSPSRVPTTDWHKFSNIIDGKPRSSPRIHNGINPATQQKLWDVPVASEQDVDDAVAAAQHAFKAWRKTTIQERRDALARFLDMWNGFAEEAAGVHSQETGKPRQFARNEVGAIAVWAAWHMTLDLPVDIEEDDKKIIKTTFKPLGVCGGICPWNYPILLAFGKIAPAVLAGNCIIVKPSPYTPYTTLKMVELAQEAFPPGVIQAVGGDDSLGPMLTSHPGIAKISFTGSIATGKKIMAACANTLKRVTLELGGNDASIVLPDVDIAKVAPEVAMGAFQNSGQVCVATKRIYIHESIYKQFVEAMVAFTEQIKVGQQNDKDVLLGPIQNKMQYEKVKQFFADSKAQGHRFAAGKSDVAASAGYFVQPTILDNPPSESKIWREEPFGPIVPCQPWSSEQDVVERANNTNTGLGACIWGKDLERAERMASELEAGTVWVNSWGKPDPKAFFGGHKESGIGGEFGKLGILSYCNAHVIQVSKAS